MGKSVQQHIQSDAIMGATLQSVRALCFAPQDEPGTAIRSAVSLQFPKTCLTLRAVPHDDRIVVGHDLLSEVQAQQAQPGHTARDWRVEDLSESRCFSRFIGKCLRNWWFLTNDAGYRDGFMVALEAKSGVCFVVMAGSIHVQLIEGEQFS